MIHYLNKFMEIVNDRNIKEEVLEFITGVFINAQPLVKFDEKSYRLFSESIQVDLN